MDILLLIVTLSFIAKELLVSSHEGWRNLLQFFFMQKSELDSCLLN